MKKLILTMLLVFSLTGIIYGQGFNSITTPDGVNLVAVGNSGKLYRSANGGVTYATYTIAGAPNLNAVCSFGNDVWFTGQNGNVYKTVKTAAPSNSYNVGSSTSLYSVYFIDANTGFACGDGGAVYKSVNGGVNWTSSNSGISSVKLNSINFTDANNGTAVGNNGTIYVTNNGGSSWTSEVSGTTRNLLRVKYFGTDIITVGEYGTLLQNTGSGWTSVSTRTTSDIRGISGTNMNDVHVCGGGGFIRNNKSGNTLFANFEKNPMLANLVDIFYYDSNNGWAVSSLNYVIVYTTNGGTSWNMPTGATVSFTWVSKSPNGSGIGNNLCKHPSDRNSAFVVYGNKVYVSRDKGESWTQIATISIGTRAHSFYVSPNDTNVWLAAMESSPDCVVRTTNYGANWSNIIAYDFSTYGQPLEMDQNNPSTFYFAPSNGAGIGMFKSINNGASFSLIAPYNQSGIGQPCDIIVMWDSSSVIYIGDDGADIWKSTNGGTNWFLVKANSSSEVPSMCNSVFDKSICYATTWGSSEVYRTLNHGSNWSIVSNNSGSGWGSDLCHEDPTVVLTGNYGSQAYLTTNGGANFFNVNTGLGGAGAGIMVTERGFMLNMQTGNLFKLNITYTDSPVLNNVDVQALSLGATGAQYYESATVNPQGTVRNNNGASSATFNVTRTITPGGYVSTKTVVNLAASTSTNVTFDQWTFNAGATYTVKDSVYISDDTNPVNDVLSGSITPFVGQPTTRLSEGFSGVYPPANWTFQYTGTNYWMYSAVSSYGVGTGSDKYNYWSSPSGTIQSMFTPTFVSTVAGDSMYYDYSYAPYTSGTDSLIIETSTNAGSTYSTLVRLYGNTTASGNFALNTAPTSGSEFTPSSAQWQTKKWGLPVGTNKIKFRARSGFGNNLYLDSIKVTGGSLYTQVNLKLSPQGLYNGTYKNLRDTVRAYLRNTISPFNKIDSAVTFIDSLTLNAACVFKYAASGTYYFQVLHRNSIETWSKTGGESFTRGVTSGYDFTSAASQAYGNNMILVGSKYCFYSGDVNQDGVIEGSDLSLIDNDASNFASGYLVTDLNGDGVVDGSDLLLADNNASNFVTKVTPEN